jgi:hypothetical protein
MQMNSLLITNIIFLTLGRAVQLQGQQQDFQLEAAISIPISLEVGDFGLHFNTWNLADAAKYLWNQSEPTPVPLPESVAIEITAN